MKTLGIVASFIAFNFCCAMCIMNFYTGNTQQAIVSAGLTLIDIALFMYFITRE